MRYDKGRRAASRERIVAAAARRFRCDGVAGTGIAAIMADAGLTVGAFSGHFESKEQLIREVLQDTLTGQTAQVSDRALAQVVAEYLSVTHRDTPAEGCVTSALVAEVARQSLDTRQEFTDRLLGVIDAIMTQLPLATGADSRRLGLTIFAQLVGAVQLARAIPDEQLSRDILTDAAEAALALARRGAAQG